VDLSDHGKSEACKAGQLLKAEGYSFDVAYTSLLKRAIHTLWVVLDEMDLMWIPVYRSWRLNERHYGALQGFNKLYMAKKYTPEQVQKWRRGYGIRPPSLTNMDSRHPRFDPRYIHLKEAEIPRAESLKDTLQRVLPYWHEIIAPSLRADKKVLISAHGNSLRAFVKYLDNVSDNDVAGLDIPTGLPLVYELDNGLKTIRHYSLIEEESKYHKNGSKIYFGVTYQDQKEDKAMDLKKDEIIVPLDVPKAERENYINNYLKITQKSGRLMLFAGDQKVEHLNNDFYGQGIHADDSEPEHLFRIANQAKIGVFATQLGLIARYGKFYSDLPYLVKLNSKTNLVKTSQSDPFSNQWLNVQQVADFRNNSGLNILAVGYTVYLGSEYESEMLHQAAQIVFDAHQHGLITVLWVYPRGKAVADEKDPHLIAGATGVAASLGSDFVKVNYPKKEGCESKEIFKEVIQAAGLTKVVCAGGSSDDVEDFLKRLHDQIHVSGASGNATGRNIHQKSLKDAAAMCNAIYAITVENVDVEEALKIYHSN